MQNSARRPPAGVRAGFAFTLASAHRSRVLPRSIPHLGCGFFSRGLARWSGSCGSCQWGSHSQDTAYVLGLGPGFVTHLLGILGSLFPMLCFSSLTYKRRGWDCQAPMGPREGAVRTECAHRKPSRPSSWHSWVGGQCGPLGASEHSWLRSWILFTVECWRLTPFPCVAKVAVQKLGYKATYW